MNTKLTPPMIGGKPLSPVHYSEQHGVHADLGTRQDKIHIPYQGQTTINTFIKGPTLAEGMANDRQLANLGGTLKPR